MKKIILVVNPFADRGHHSYVYENGNKLDEIITTDEKNLVETLFAWRDTHEVNNLDIVGPQGYAAGFEKKVQEAELDKYSENKFNITLI